VIKGSSSPGTVLVVDDEETNRVLLERLLRSHGYEVLTAASGEAALSTLRQLRVDLVLLDVQMPGANGFDICTQIKRTPETRLIPVALVTGLNDREDKIRGLRAGADDFIAKPFDREELQARVASLVRLKQYTDDLDSTEGILRSLALIIEARDQYTDGHCDRLAHYAVALGTALGLSAEDLAALDRGGYLHDIGKIGIPDALLLKPSALTVEEFNLMKQHTVIGDRLCGELRSLRLVRDIVRHHHERLDGSGYPDGLRGDQVSVLAQIVSTVDLYDAVTTARPYRDSLPIEYAFTELRDEARRGLRQPEMVETFINLVKNGELGAPAEPSGTAFNPSRRAPRVVELSSRPTDIDSVKS
jgi:putative two-component system response regulator